MAKFRARAGNYTAPVDSEGVDPEMQRTLRSNATAPFVDGRTRVVDATGKLKAERPDSYRPPKALAQKIAARKQENARLQSERRIRNADAILGVKPKKK